MPFKTFSSPMVDCDPRLHFDLSALTSIAVTLLFFNWSGYMYVERWMLSLRPARNRPGYSVGAEPKQFIYLEDWLDPLLQKADCLFQGKSKVLFCTPIDVPFPPHQSSVKVLATQWLHVCLTNTVQYNTEVLARPRAWVDQSESVMVLSFSFCIHEIRKCQVRVQRADDSRPSGPLIWLCGSVFKFPSSIGLRRKIHL